MLVSIAWDWSEETKVFAAGVLRSLATNDDNCSAVGSRHTSPYVTKVFVAGVLRSLATNDDNYSAVVTVGCVLLELQMVQGWGLVQASLFIYNR